MAAPCLLFAEKSHQRWFKTLPQAASRPSRRKLDVQAFICSKV